MRTLLILADGMRPDAIENKPYVMELLKKSTYTLNAQTVSPSVTLPAHMSLFHSVNPSRHGILTNDYVPQVRPIDGIFDVLSKNKKKCAFFYDWEELRDLSRPSSLEYSCMYKGEQSYEESCDYDTKMAIEFLNEHNIDFAFLYFGYPDEAGHCYGWMGKEYMKAIDKCWENIQKIIEELPDDYNVIITADHGGHDQLHGTDCPEDMTIPLIMTGPDFEQNKVIKDVNIKDIAPTIAEILGVEKCVDWVGKSLISK